MDETRKTTATLTDEQIDGLVKQHTWFNGSHAMTNYRDLVRAAIALAAQPAQAATEPHCWCGDRKFSECPGQWEPGCDLGANAKHAVAAPPEAEAALSAALGSVPAPVQAGEPVDADDLIPRS
jgi:hypothetical protein